MRRLLIAFIFISISIIFAKVKFNQGMEKELEKPMQKIATRKEYSKDFQENLNKRK